MTTSEIEDIVKGRAAEKSGGMARELREAGIEHCSKTAVERVTVVDR